MKKVLCAILLVPIVLSVAYWIVNFGTGLMTGEVNFVTWIVDHKALLTFIVCFVLLGFVGPFKKD